MTSMEIDVLKLWAGTIKGFEDTKAWNRWLSICFTHEKMGELMNVRKGIQMGMVSAQRRGLVTEKLATVFCRWTHSIDLTVKRIVKKRRGKLDYKDKKQMDADVEAFLRKESL